MQNQKKLLAVMVSLPALISIFICAAMCAGSEDTKNAMTAISMFGLAAIQVFVGVMVFGPRGLLNGYEMAKK